MEIIYLVEEYYTYDRNAFSTSYIPSGEARQLEGIVGPCPPPSRTDLHHGYFHLIANM